MFDFIKRTLHIGENGRMHTQRSDTFSLDAYKYFFDNSTEAILIADILSEKIIAANEAASRLFKRPIEQLVGMSQKQMHPPDVTEHFRKSYQDRVQGGMLSFDNEMDIVTSEGERVPVRLSSVILHLGLRPIILANFSDLTHVRRLETIVASKEAYFKQLADNTPDMMANLDLNGNIEFANLAHIRVLELPADEMEGKCYFEFFSGKDRLAVENLFRMTIKKQDVQAKRMRMLKVNGEEIVVDVMGNTILDQKGMPMGVVITCRDVTEQVRAEQRLRESEENLKKFKLAVDGASDQVVITDMLDRIVYANPSTERITGFSIASIMGKHPSALWRKTVDKTIEQNIRQTVYKKKQPISIELACAREDGSTFIAQNESTPLTNDRKKVCFSVCMTRDITHAKEVNRMKTEFVSMAAHELRTPLASIRWFIELLKDAGEKYGSDVLEYIQEIEDGNTRLLKLVNELLNVTRIETGRKFTIEPKQGDMRELIESTINELVGFAEAKNILVQISGKIPANNDVWFDEDKARLLFQNLIENAIKYSHEGDRVEIGGKETDEGLVLFVKDEGIGIPKHQQSRIFERFFRAENAQTATTTGTGLGLFIAKSIVEGHGGRLWFESTLNKGTTFFVLMPTRSLQLEALKQIQPNTALPA